MPSGYLVQDGHQRAKESLPRVPQPIGMGKYVSNLTFPPHSSVKESGLFEYQEEDSSQSDLRMELQRPKGGLRE